MSREVDVLWTRVVLPIVTVGLFIALDFYEDPAPAPGDLWPPFDSWAIRRWLWDGDPPSASEWVGQLNYLSALGYVMVAVALVGRVTLRAAAVLLAGVGVVALAGLLGLGYLVVTDPASFPLTGTGAGTLRVLFLLQLIGIGVLVSEWLQLRAAALRVQRESS